MTLNQQQTITPAEALEILDYYSNERQVDFVRDVLGRNPWPLQEEIIKAVFKYPVVAVKSCNAAGKSDVASDIALAFLMLKPGGIVITTAPTWRQVKDVLWRYIRDKYAKAPYKLSDKQCNQVGLDLAEDWFAVGLSTKDSEKFFGYHADDILVIVDEASGVEEEVYIGVDAVTPNLNAHVLMIGNPTNPDGRFYKAFQDPLVKKFTISVFDTPNFTANGIRNLEDLLTLFTPPADAEQTETMQLEHMQKVQKQLKMPIPALISPSTVYRRYLQWGDEHPMWEALIMGQFPSQSSTALIPLGLILKSVEVWKQINASKRNKEYAKKPEWNIELTGIHEYGLDVARFGDDSNVLFPKIGGYIEKPIKWAKVDTAITTDRVINHISLDDWLAVIKVDDIGVGGAVTDQLRRRKQDNPELYHYTVIPINFASGTTKPEKYYNLRTEIYDNLAQMFIDHKIAIPDDEELIAELATIRVEYTGKDTNIKKVEAKDKIKERLMGRSPDKADALALACAKSGRGSWLDDLPAEEKISSEPPKQYEKANSSKPYTAGMIDERF